MLRIEGVTAGYGSTTVLRDVTVTVPDSSVVALLGPNGAGKTTLLRVASGLLHPAAGRLVFDGEDVTGRAPYQLTGQGLCHVPEGRGIFPSLSVRENLVLFSHPGTERVSTERAIEVFPDLRNRLGQLAGTMSGGQQQMLALARAYIAGAKVILLDEVSMGLAPLIVDQIFEFLTRIAQEGIALLLVEQYVNKALSISDYVYVLGRGRVQFAGDAAELADDDLFHRYLGVEAAGVAT